MVLVGCLGVSSRDNEIIIPGLVIKHTVRAGNPSGHNIHVYNLQAVSIVSGFGTLSQRTVVREKM